MKKIPVTIFLVVIIAGGIGVFYSTNRGTTSDTQYHADINSSVYKEYVFDSAGEPDLGYTKRVYNALRESQVLLDQGSQVSSDGKPMDEGEFNRVWKNNTVLSERKTEYGADGPFIDKRMVDGKPAITLRIACNQHACEHDIFYDTEFINKKYGIKNSRYLFSYDGKVGFVASDETGDRIFFNGDFITPAFDSIHTANCCSYLEVLPTVYENGVLLFYGTRENKYHLVEVQLT